MSFPTETTVLIIGAGPAGLVCALSLLQHGVSDFVIVDAVEHWEQSSRSLIVHAATLEALEPLGVVEAAVQAGIPAKAISISDRHSTLFSVDFMSLHPYTRHPYILVLPQQLLEGIFRDKLQSHSVRIFRPYRMIGMRESAQRGMAEVSFEGGAVMRARYVIGADGSHSTVRQVTGIRFADPAGRDMQVENIDQSMSIVFSDIKFSHVLKVAPAGVFYVLNDEAFFIAIPLPHDSKTTSPLDQVYRVGCNIPDSMGPPPSNPPTAYTQDLLDRFGPSFLSSDPSVNPDPVHISATVWSSRFRNRSGLADRFFVRFGGAVAFLIGDAAHIHPPSGGQGMNLGMRDAIGLGKVIAEHIKLPEEDGVLEAYAELRHRYAVDVIGLTNKIFNTFTLGRFLAWTPLPRLRNWALWCAGKIPWVRTLMAYRLTGLGMR